VTVHVLCIVVLSPFLIKHIIIIIIITKSSYSHIFLSSSCIRVCFGACSIDLFGPSWSDSNEVNDQSKNENTMRRGMKSLRLKNADSCQSQHIGIREAIATDWSYTCLELGECDVKFTSYVRERAHKIPSAESRYNTV